MVNTRDTSYAGFSCWTGGNQDDMTLKTDKSMRFRASDCKDYHKSGFLKSKRELDFHRSLPLLSPSITFHHGSTFHFLISEHRRPVSKALITLTAAPDGAFITEHRRPPHMHLLHLPPLLLLLPRLFSIVDTDRRTRTERRRNKTLSATMMKIRPTIAADTDALMSILMDSGQFGEEGVAYVRGILEQYLKSNNDVDDETTTDNDDATKMNDMIWLTAVEDNDDDAKEGEGDQPVAVAYCAPEAVADGTWNLLMLWTRADRQRRGYGGALDTAVEKELVNRNARLFMVETSSLPAQTAARAFYSSTKCSFVHEATIRNYYADGDDKLIYTKPLLQMPVTTSTTEPTTASAIEPPSGDAI
jgi:ribosomal protein S18 acetylase RimI-like enzyme